MGSERTGAALAWDPEAELGAKPAPKRKRSRGAGRWDAFNTFMDFTHAGLTPAARSVWLALFRYTDHKAGSARVSQATLADRGGIGDRAVRKGIAELKDAGLLDVKRHGNRDSGASVYVVRPVNRNGSSA